MIKIVVFFAFIATTLAVCSVNIGTAQSTNCGAPDVFCTYVTAGDESDLDCRSCNVRPGGAITELSVFDPLNMCNCIGGQYCTQAGDAGSALGVCMDSRILGMQCNTSSDCEGARLVTADGSNGRLERGFCVNGHCGQCNPSTFEGDWGAMSYVCPGFQLNGENQRVYDNSNPRIVITCSQDGHMVASGVADWEYREGGLAPTTTTSAHVPSSDGDDNGSIINLLKGTVATVVVGFIITWIGLCIACLAIYVISKRGSSGSFKGERLP